MLINGKGVRIKKYDLKIIIKFTPSCKKNVFILFEW